MQQDLFGRRAREADFEGFIFSTGPETVMGISETMNLNKPLLLF